MLSRLKSLAATVFSIWLALHLAVTYASAAAVDTVQPCKTVSAESLLTIGGHPAILDKNVYDFDLGAPKSYQNQIGFMPTLKPADKFASMVKNLPYADGRGGLGFQNLKNPDNVKWVYTLTGLGGERVFVYLFHEDQCRMDFMPFSALSMTALHPGAAGGST